MKSLNVAHIPALDHLRLLAALLVFAFHVFHFYFGQWQPAPYAAALGLITEGHTGVALFFVLSGFLFFFFIAISVGRDDFRAADVLYVFFSNLGQAPTSGSFITGAAWTISVEFTFYLVFPFLARFVRAEGAGYLLRLIALMALVKLAAYGVTERSTHMFYSTLVGRFDQFLWGMLAAVLWTQHRTWFERHGRVLLALAVALVWAATSWQARFASHFSPDPRQAAWVVWGTVEALMWSALVLGYVGARIVWPAPLARALERGGEWSYSFYLWHGLLLYVLHRYVGVWTPFGSVALNALANFAVLLPLALALAALSYTTIERPFLRLRGGYVHSGSASLEK